MNKFKLNGKEYKAKAFDYNMVCDLEDAGIPLEDFGKKSRKIVREYFALCSGLSSEEAGNEIEAHIINGGDMADISEAFSKEMDQSDFFQALIKRAETADAENETEKK